jgi:hypothetical protein
VLHSFQNVADVLRALEYDASTLAAQAAANSAAKGSLEIVQHEYNFGVANYLDVLSAEQQVQQNALNLITAQSRRLIDSVALYQAMGGGVLLPEHSEINQVDDQGLGLVSVLFNSVLRLGRVKTANIPEQVKLGDHINNISLKQKA